ncbi:hypothetical protein GG344DRAFT_79460 [Lentinula edodes]|nr:hypothetical protein GG344DRAFT_79460 [Lentinula edodes]
MLLTLQPFPTVLKATISVWIGSYPKGSDNELYITWLENCWTHVWLSDNLVDHIGAWLGACIGMPWNPEHCHDLGLLVEVFMAVIEASQCKQQKHEALQHLEAYYYQIIRHLRQKNLLTLAYETDAELYDGSDSESNDGHFVPSSVVLTSRQKRRKHSQDNRVFPEVVTFEFLLQLMTGCATVLQGLISSNEALKVSRNDIVQVVKLLRDIKVSLSRQHVFQKAVVQSGLIQIIQTLTHPTYFCQPEHYHLDGSLELTYRLSEHLSFITSRWIHPSIREKWRPPEYPLYHSIPASGPQFKSVSQFFSIFQNHPFLVPGLIHHDYIFFLTSFESFTYNFDRWLGPALKALNFKLQYLQKDIQLKNLYSKIMSRVSQWCIVGDDSLPEIDTLEMDERWRVILKRTYALRKCFEMALNHAKKLRGCTKCLNLPPLERCVQYRYFPRFGPGLSEMERSRRADILAKEMKHTSVTLVPLEKQMIPKPMHDGSANKALYHPSSYGTEYRYTLLELDCNDAILNCCSHQLYLILDDEENLDDPQRYKVQWGDKKIIVNFAWYGVFPPHLISFLQQIAVQTTGVKPLRRGGQFQTYHTGNMTPIGSRLASGGRELDTYAPYAGLDTKTNQGIHILFDQATVSQLILGTARIAHPELVKKILELSKNCDRLGLAGANIYNCTGYVAPGHRDKDAAPSLSVQALLLAESQYAEFAFCHFERQFYVKSRTNLLWDFDANFTHGTMLPSRRTLQNLNSQAIPNAEFGSNIRRGVTASNGHHLTITKKNCARAEANATIRAQYSSRSQYWKELEQKL